MQLEWQSLPLDTDRMYCAPQRLFKYSHFITFNFSGTFKVEGRLLQTKFVLFHRALSRTPQKAPH